MGLLQRLIEAPPSLRWHTSRAATAVYRRVFGSIGPGTVIVRPHKLSGVDRIHIGSGCSIYERAWLACEPHGGPLIIGDNTYLGHDVHLHAIDPITIGSGCVLADGVFIASSDHDRDNRHDVHGTGPITIGNRVFIGQRAVVLGGVTVGDGATVAAHAVVTKNVSPGTVVAGAPARVISQKGEK